MKPETLQAVSQVLVFVGVIVSAVGGFGVFHFGKVADRAKDAKTAQREQRREEQMASLVEGMALSKNSWHPLGMLQRGSIPALKPMRLSVGSCARSAK
jgi:hypothetical protein